jgi:type I restriction enzyme, R subunit
MTDQFSFLATEWPEVHEAACKAAAAVHPDPRTACFYARRALELAVTWAFKHDRALHLPYDDKLSALIHDPGFKKAAGEAVFAKARLLNTLGNQAVHSHRVIQWAEAQQAARELFHVAYWFARSYARRDRPAANLAFDEVALPKTAPVPKQTLEQLQRLETSIRERDEKLVAALADRDALGAELERVRAEVAEAKKAAEAHPDAHDYDEQQTRDVFIDLMLREAGWALAERRDREFPVTGMPGPTGAGAVDYVLWGDDGKPLGLVEAKRTRRDAREGQQQAKLYADCLERQFGQRPVMFYSNGYEHWLWDDLRYPPRQVLGFYTKLDLELAVQRRASRKTLKDAIIRPAIVERYYQTRAVRRVAEAFEQDAERKALLVMATGSGKTRTVIALCDLLVRCNWVKRVLFLADRRALVRQAISAFKEHLPDSAPVNLVEERDTDGRVYASTYPTIMGLIDEARLPASESQRRFGVGYFDLVIIDEAHRSVFQKYRAIFQYFDALLVGLTATPKDEVDRDTYRLFDLEKGVPTDAYSLEDAVRDGFLVPARAVSVPLRFQREGIRYDDLPDEEKDRWDAVEWDEDGSVPAQVDAEAVNKWLFNADTVDKVLAHLMTRGQKVAGGDRLGKTLIFAKNQAHAEFIEARFNKHYPHLKGSFARIITVQVEHAQTLIDDFYQPDKPPHIAISVDMMDTGIDVPEIVNLVFFKVVRSKTKFWQMLGRGTRLRPDLFGPGQEKQFFYIFDYCQNLEFFSHAPDVSEGSASDSLGKRLFKRRLEVLSELDRRGTPPASAGDRASDASLPFTDALSDADVRGLTARLMQDEVAAMNVDNFVVRPRRRLVQKYADAGAWVALSDADRTELASEVAGLPSEQAGEPEETRRFDLLMLNLQLAVLRAQPAFMRLRDQVKAIASALEDKASIPMVRDRLALIAEMQTDEWWQDVTVAALESARGRLRTLMSLIEKRQRTPIYTDFEDELGAETEVAMPVFSAPSAFRKFRAKAQAFLRQHEDHVSIRKLRMNKPLTSADLAELERMLAESGGAQEDIEHARGMADGLGLFVRSLVGLDRQAAKEALAGFLEARALTGKQIEFVNLIVEHLTAHGVMTPARLYESPFTDITPQGPEGIFNEVQVNELVAVLGRVRATAMVG